MSGSQFGLSNRSSRLPNCYALSASIAFLFSMASGCGSSGDITVPKEARARIISDADEKGNVTLPKTRNPRKPAAGLRTARSILDKKGD